MARTFTGSDFDHVGMVWRYKNDLYIFEACIDIGVRVQKWKHKRLRYGILYERMVWRHLSHERSPESLEILEKFVREALGRKYSFSMGQLINGKSPRQEIAKPSSGEL